MSEWGIAVSTVVDKAGEAVVTVVAQKGDTVLRWPILIDWPAGEEAADVEARALAVLAGQFIDLATALSQAFFKRREEG
ncbi:hypothetical protein [Brevundimonas subvibrioides]|uniref:Uncharacterized protein n=1 Tax=Brevundimonas subvibrioides (strain ATCC 15264 / DSM 4735 / LMG 14903 / NBRC 16000 / CB 81) TaxID=633149 RepID=D9QI82_BRESC|nr:hypothetical protein [Brevundimonas subvibrioides]ADK99384.1 hypothetical protein Bresu_0070 [Brevundimonas subvibrioides ATCC 15264]